MMLRSPIAPIAEGVPQAAWQGFPIPSVAARPSLTASSLRASWDDEDEEEEEVDDDVDGGDETPAPRRSPAPETEHDPFEDFDEDDFDDDFDDDFEDELEEEYEIEPADDGMLEAPVEDDIDLDDPDAIIDE